jgi:hypothetical protein
VNDPEPFSWIPGRTDRLTRFPVDIDRLERIEPETRESIEANGRVVYDRR